MKELKVAQEFTNISSLFNRDNNKYAFIKTFSFICNDSTG